MKITLTALGTVVTIIGVVVGGVIGAETRYAKSIEVAEGLKAIVAQQQSKMCTTWLAEIMLLEDREADNRLTETQRTRLHFLQRQHEAHCNGND